MGQNETSSIFVKALDSSVIGIMVQTVIEVVGQCKGCRGDDLVIVDDDGDQIEISLVGLPEDTAENIRHLADNEYKQTRVSAVYGVRIPPHVRQIPVMETQSLQQFDHPLLGNTHFTLSTMTMSVNNSFPGFS